jgi:predicted MPP superfamily phosphohydrolase
MHRRTFLRTALIAGAGIAAPAAARAATAPRLRVTRHRIPWDHLGRPLRIAHLTDIHVSWITPKEMLDQALEAVWAAKPDLVALTGDYVNRNLTRAAELKQWIASLPKPCVATLGNHDYWSGAGGVVEALTAGGAQVLMNDSLKLNGTGWALRVVGVDDGRTGHDRIDRAFREVERDERPLVLTHFPATADRIAERSNGLTVAGHTHGGQFNIPGVTAALASLGGVRYLAGWYSVGPSELYVSAGIGISSEGMRGGRGATPEVALYDLMPRPALGERVSSEALYRAGRFARVERSPTPSFDPVL